MGVIVEKKNIMEVLRDSIRTNGALSIKNRNILKKEFGIRASFLEELAKDRWAAEQRPELLKKNQELETERFRLQKELAEAHKTIRKIKKRLARAIEIMSRHSAH